MSTTTKPKKTADEKDHDYLAGRRAANIRMLQHFLSELCVFDADREDPLFKIAALESERLQAIQKLRGICEEHGDNDWEDDLHLADIIGKHLGDRLDERAEEDGDDAS